MSLNINMTTRITSQILTGRTNYQDMYGYFCDNVLFDIYELPNYLVRRMGMFVSYVHLLFKCTCFTSKQGKPLVE